MFTHRTGPTSQATPRALALAPYLARRRRALFFPGLLLELGVKSWGSFGLPQVVTS